MYSGIKGTKLQWILLVSILVLASFFRLWQLDQLPPGLWPDEAINATTAVEILKTGEFQIFYSENHGREGFFFLLVSFAFGIFGVSIWAFKLVPALVGILTVLGQFFLTRELFSHIASFKKSAPFIALLSSFFLAVSVWHVMFSRIGFRAILMPLVLVFSFAFLLKGLRTKRFLDFALSGVFIGLGLHTYISFRLTALVLAVVFLLWLVLAIRERWTKRYLSGMALLSFFTLLVASPILLYFSQNPEDFLFRAGGVSVFAQEEPLSALGESAAKHLAMFNIAGDQNWRHNVAGQPQLPYAVGIFFLIGLGAFFWKTIASSFTLIKTKFADKEAQGSFLVGKVVFAWFFVLLLPGILTFEGIPHALRVLGVIPIVYLFAGLGAYLSFLVGKKLLGSKPSLFLLGLVLFGSAALSFHSYFVTWKNSEELEGSFTLRFMDVGYKLNSYPEETSKYVVMSEGDLPVEVPRFLQHTENRQEAVYLSPGELEAFPFSSGNLLFTMNKELHVLDPVRERFPEGTLREQERIWIYEIP